jgi:hypothetical protein
MKTITLFLQMENYGLWRMEWVVTHPAKWRVHSRFRRSQSRWQPPEYETKMSSSCVFMTACSQHSPLPNEAYVTAA